MAAVSGTVKNASGNFAQKLVRVYRRDSGALVGQTLSNATTGAWSVTTAGTAEHFALVHDTASYDSYWPQTVLAMHMDGTNGSTTFTDLKGKAFTVGGNAKISTEQSKFGGASGYFDSSGDYIRHATHTDFDFGTGDFTVDFFLYVVAHTDGNAAIFSTGGATWVTGQRIFRFNGGNISFWGYEGGNMSAGSAFPTGSWKHVAFERYGTALTIYMNGASVATMTYGGAMNMGSGGYTYFANSLFDGRGLNGYIDDLRVVKGAARFKGAFTAPTTTFIDGIAAEGAENAVILDRLVPV